LALQAAEHVRKLTATDLNPRAINFAEFNARLNGLENSIECLVGDTLEPVRDRSFDLIVSNPPFFVSPSNRDLFCDNPMELDAYCRRVVREASAHLNEGGYLQLLSEWVQVDGQPWQERISEWLEGTGCDAWILKGYTDHPSQYAQKRIRETSLDAADPEGRVYSEWVEYYRRAKVEAIYGGLIALRRRSGRNWTRWDEIGTNPKEPFGDSVLAAFEARDFLDAHETAEAIRATRPRLAPNVRLDQQFHPKDGHWQSTSMQLVLTSGLPFSTGVQPLVAEFIAQCDGTRTLAELISSLADQVNANRDQVEHECIALIRKLIERGFVTVATP
jgi:methylase of polypeptide subunit release factors